MYKIIKFNKFRKNFGIPEIFNYNLDEVENAPWTNPNANKSDYFNYCKYYILIFL